MSTRTRRGSAMIEFALTLPLIAFLLAAVVDWGSYMSLRTEVARAAADGARKGAATYEPSTVSNGALILPAARTRSQLVLDQMGLGCSSPDCVITAKYCTVGDASGNCGGPPLETVLVTVRYVYTPFFGFASTPSLITERSMFAVESQ